MKIRNLDFLLNILIDHNFIHFVQSYTILLCTQWTFSAKVESIMRGGTNKLSAPNLSTNLKD